MEVPIVAPAPIVTAHAEVFRDLVDHQCQFRHFQPYLTGLIVLPNKSLATIARGILDSADKPNLSRFLSAAPWREDTVNRRRIRCMLQQTEPHRRRRRESLVVLDDTLCEHVGSLFDDVDRHDNHSDGTYPLAHTPVTSLYGSGAVRFPLSLRLYRRDEELTQWAAALAQPFPDLPIPREKQARNRLHQQVDPVVLQDPDFRARHEQFRTTMALAIDLVGEAIRCKVPVGVVVFDAWYLAEDLVRVLARRRKDWISLLKTNRGLETASFQRRDVNGWALKLPGPHLAVEDLVPLIPATAYRPIKVREQTYWCFTLAVRLAGVGKVRVVMSFEDEALTGRSVVLVTNRVDWSAAKIIGLYLHRWPTETFDQDSKGHLGFNAYRMRSAEAIGNQWCRVFVAYSLVHLTCLPAGPDRTQGLMHTIGDACRQQGRALIQNLLVFVHDRLSQSLTIDHVFAGLFAKQRGLVPT
ncbi:MAG: IS701 family transposase [Candidatus Entotheonellia bacterium]